MGGDDDTAAPVDLDTTGTAIATDRADALAGTLHRVAVVLDGQAGEVGAAWPPVRVLLVDDFTAAVTDVIERLRGRDAPARFGTLRMGGTVAAKTMPDPLVEGGRVIVVDAALATLEDPDIVGVPVITQAFLLAHELAHVLIESTRQASGVHESLPVSLCVSEHFAQGVVRTAMDEYRADMIAAHTVAELYTVPGENGQDVAARVADTAAISFLGGVVDDLTALHPALPDTVDRYRNHLLSLGEMWAEVQRATEQGLNLLAHAQAVLDSSFPVRRNILSLSEFQSRASRLYFEALWEAIRRPLVRLPVLPSANDHARHEPALLEAGKAAITVFWGLLGIRTEALQDGSEYLHVGAPTR